MELKFRNIIDLSYRWLQNDLRIEKKKHQSSMPVIDPVGNTCSKVQIIILEPICSMGQGAALHKI